MEIEFSHKESPEAFLCSLSDCLWSVIENSQWETALEKISLCTITVENSSNLQSWTNS